MSKKGKLFVSGGNGMVARNILEHPKATEWEVLSPVRSELDLADFNAVITWMEREKPDAVIHAAGRVGGIQANMAHPVEFLVENVDVGRNIILAARKIGVRKLINLASSCVYPRAAPNPLDEDLILKGELEPTNEGYALAKIFALRLCQFIRRENASFEYKTLLPCNLYGRFDKFSPEHSHLIPAIIHKMHAAKKSGAETVEIWGDGLARREFMYTGDTGEAVLLALDDIAIIPDLMNIGLGTDHTINEYYEQTAKVMKWNGKFSHDLTKPVGMNRKLVAIERQKKWGWMPKTSLNEGLAKTYEFYLKEVVHEL